MLFGVEKGADLGVKFVGFAAGGEVAAVGGEGDDLGVDEWGEGLGGSGVDHVVLLGDDDEDAGMDAFGGVFKRCAVGDVVVDHGLQLVDTVVGVEFSCALGAVCGVLVGEVVAGNFAVVVAGGGEVHVLEDGSEGEGGSPGVVAELPGGALADGVFLGVPEEEIPGGEAGRADDGHCEVHEVRMVDDPLEGLHAAHGDADDGMEVGDVEGFRQEAVLGLNHVGDGEGGEGHARLGFGVGGG